MEMLIAEWLQRTRHPAFLYLREQDFFNGLDMEEVFDLLDDTIHNLSSDANGNLVKNVLSFCNRDELFAHLTVLVKKELLNVP